MKNNKNHLPAGINEKHSLALKTALHFGFVPFAGLEVTKTDISKARTFPGTKFDKTLTAAGELDFGGFLEEKISIIRSYIEKKMQDLTQPAMICYSGPLKGNPHASSSSKVKLFNVDIIGNPKGIADAIVIETAYAILGDHYKGMKLELEINSIGDKESLQKFAREFVAYFKKHLDLLPAGCRASFKKDPFSILNCEHDTCSSLLDEAPKSMGYLSDESRTHFKEVLEYVESLGISYSINHCLVGSQHYCSGIIFRITGIPEKAKSSSESKVLALGERYNSVARKAWGKKEIPAIGATIVVEDSSKQKSVAPKKGKNTEPKFYFIQLGQDAKMKSLAIIEMLRQAKIPVTQSLSKDKLSNQLAQAEKLAVPYILLVGQKEAIEGSVTIRNMKNMSQETVPLNTLVVHLRKIT